MRGPKFQTTPLALEAAKSGLGVAISNREFVEDHIRQGSLVAPFQVEVPSESGYYLVYPEEHASEPKIEAFRDWLLAAIEQETSGARGPAGAGVTPRSALDRVVPTEARFAPTIALLGRSFEHPR